jgi:hypothetical protein
MKRVINKFSFAFCYKFTISNKQFWAELIMPAVLVREIHKFPFLWNTTIKLNLVNVSS